MELSILSVPYDSGLRGVRMGAGPEHLMAAGLPDRLAALGHKVDVSTVIHETEPPAEIRTGFELMAGVAAAVRVAVAAGRLPVVISGNCNISVGTVAGVGADAGVVWFDAHGDFNTPETTNSGFLDSTGLATLVGRCWQAISATVPGYRAVPETDVMLVGVRDTNPAEADALAASPVTVITPAELRDGPRFRSALDDLARRVRDIYLHIDLDVIDPAYGRANTYAAPGGISPAELGTAIAELGRRLRICALGLASYDPATDHTGSICQVAIEAAGAAVSSAHDSA